MSSLTQKKLNPAAHLYAHIAAWFSDNPPGTPAPDWCFLAWPLYEEDIEFAIKEFERDTGQSVFDSPQS